MNQQLGIPHGLRSLTALILGAAFCVLFIAPVWAQTTLVVNNAAAANCNNDGTTGVYCTIQAAIDAAAPSDTINVYPGAYSETASERTIIGSGGIYQFGLFVGKNNLTIQGVDAGGAPIAAVPETGTVLPAVTTNATNNFGPSGIWVEGDGVTIRGLRILNNIGGENKTFEITGNAFTLRYSHINVVGGGSVYFNDVRYVSPTAHIESYTIDGNLFSHGSSIDLTSGTGASGPVAGRMIVNNKWLSPPSDSRALVSFSGSSVVPWFVHPVGGAQITGNIFDAAPQYVRARGVYTETDFDWAAIWGNNTFAKAVMVGTNPPADVRAFSYNTSYGLMTNVRRIGGLIQGEIDNAQPGDTVLIKAGLYEENLTINKHVKLVGAGSGSDPADGTIIRQVVTNPRQAALTLSGSGESVANPLLLEHLRIEPKGYYGINMGSLVRYVRINDVQIIGSAAVTIEDEVCLKVSSASSLDYLDVQDSAFNGCDYGWYIAKQYNPPDASYVRNVTVRNTAFNNNSFKGIYTEKLSDTLFENVQAVNNGSQPFWNNVWNGGIDINLKAGSYQNLTFRNLTVTGNGKGFQHGAGLMIKARDDGTTYGLYPATLANVLIEGGLFTGNERGIRIGEPDKNNAGPTGVQIHGASLYGNVKTYAGSDGSAYGDLINYTLSPIDATGSWWGVDTGPVVVAAGAGLVNAASTPVAGVIYLGPLGEGGVDSTSFLTEPPPTTLAILNATHNLPDATTTIAVPVEIDPGGASLAAVAFSLDYDQTCLSVAATDANGDDLPDAITGIPSGFTATGVVDTADTAGELDIAVYDLTEPLAALPTGTLLTIQFTVSTGPACRAADRNELVNFSSAPAPTFGTTVATNAAGTWLGGTLALDFNQPATAINLTGDRVYEGQTSGIVGALSVADPDAWETFSYALAAGGTHNALFTIDGSQVKAVGPFNYDTAPSLTIKVTATGSGGTVITQDLTINVADYSTLSLPAASAYLYGVRGSAVAVPVSIDVRSNAVTKAGFTVNYDAACLSFTSVSGLPSGWGGSGTAGSGTVAVTMEKTTGAALSSGPMVVLNFSATGACGAYPSPLAFSAKALEDASGPVSARSSDGAIRIIANSPRGDCNSDGAVGAGDFVAVVLENFDGDGSFWLDAPLPAFPGSPIGCNANGAGTPGNTIINISDLSCTVNIFFGKTACTGGAGAASTALTGKPAALAQGQAVAGDRALEVPVTLQSNGNAIGAAAFALTYDPAKYTLDTTDADQDGIPDAVTFHLPGGVMRWAFVNAEEGKLQVAAAGLQLPMPTFADGPIATVRLQAQPGADGAGIGVNEASLGSTDGFSVPVEVLGPDGGTATGKVYLPTITQ